MRAYTKRSIGIGIALLALVLPEAGRSGLLRASAPDAGQALELPAEAVAAARALAQASDAIEAGEFERARAALTRARTGGFVLDHIDLLGIRLLLAEGRHREAERAAQEAAGRHAASPVRGEYEALRARALAGRGREAQAQLAWLSARDATGDSARRRQIELEIVRSRQRAGQLDATADPSGLRALAFPETALAHELPTGHRSAALALASADALMAEGRGELAIAAYEEALAGDLESKQRQHARLQRAHSLFRLRRYEQAVRAFAELGELPEARIGHARAAARMGKPQQALREFERIASSAPPEQASYALVLAASLLRGRDDARAAALYERLVEYDAFPARAAEALWRLGWSAFLARDYTQARIRFEQMLGRQDDPVARLRPRYWAARAAQQAGRIERARREFSRIAKDWPLAYYGWRSRLRLKDTSLELRAASGAAPAETQLALSLRRLQRAALLLEADMPEAARRELDGLPQAAGSLADQLALGALLVAAGDYHEAQKLIVEGYDSQLLKAPIRGRERLWWFSWPPAYRESVERALRAGSSSGRSVERALIWAIMREESSFRPAVVSSAGARGLLQLMPETARRVAARSGLPEIAADDLFEPEINIALGSAYVRELLTRFSGRESAVIASYNAGPNAVARWLSGDAASLEDDVWIEQIPYSQTRAYVRRVLRSLWIYRSFYD